MYSKIINLIYDVNLSENKSRTVYPVNLTDNRNSLYFMKPSNIRIHNDISILSKSKLKLSFREVLHYSFCKNCNNRKTKIRLFDSSKNMVKDKIDILSI
jgi:hypothetical protein